MRYRHLGDRPANEVDTITAEGYTVVDLNASYRFDHYQIQVSVEIPHGEREEMTIIAEPNIAHRREVRGVRAPI